MVVGKFTLNLSLCLSEPNTKKLSLTGFSLSLLAEIYSFISYKHLSSTVQSQQMNSSGIDAYKLTYHLHKNETLFLYDYH